MKDNDERITAAHRSVSPQQVIRRRGLARTLLLVFLPLVVGSMIVVSILGSLYGIREGEVRAINQLELVATLKEQEINRWLRERDRDLAVLVSEPVFHQEALRLLGEASIETERLAAYSNLGIRLNEFLGKKVSFAELFLLNAMDGRTVVSTDVLREGGSHRDADYFQQGLQGSFLQPPEFDSQLNVPTLLLARPVSDEDGQAVGVLVGRVNLGDLSVLMLERTGLGETGETYLVDQSCQPVTRLRFGQAGQRVDTMGAHQALTQHTAGSDRYDNYQGTPVLGVYRWIPALQVALLAEQSEEEALVGLRGALLGLLGLMVGGGVLATLAVALISQRITRPITRLTEAATAMASGDLSRRAAIVRQDEIGILSQVFDGMADQLEELINTLEQRVAERTREFEEAVMRTQKAYVQLHEAHKKLEATTRQAQRRTIRLETVAEVSRAATSLLDPNELVRRAVDLIRERFDLYYVGLFLLDESGRWAVLGAGTGQAGRQMLKAGHKLEVGGPSMVGWCTTHAQARIALDVGAEAVRFDNPLLPETRSEMALPLISRGRVIGALDVQSAEAGAFSDEDISILQTMVDQIAVAIDNARLFAEAQTRLEEVQAAHRSYLRGSWDEFLPTKEITDYEVVQPGVTPPGDAVLPIVQQVMAQQRTVALSSDGDEEGGQAQSALATPISLRGQIIGALGLHEAGGTRQWTADEIALVEAVADQMALAIENARLFEEDQRRLRELTTLYEASQACLSISDPGSLLAAIIKAAAQTTGATVGSMMLVDEKKGEYVLGATYGLSPETIAAMQTELHIPLGKGLVGAVVATGQALVVADVTVDPRWVPFGAREPMRSFLGVPLMGRGGRPLGAITLSHPEAGAFDENHARLLSTFANQAALAIENARLLEATQARARRERLIREITGKVQRSIDLEAILKTTVQELGKALDVSHAVVRLGTEAELATPHVEGQTDSDVREP